jgi:hypothetical protein
MLDLAKVQEKNPCPVTELETNKLEQVKYYLVPIAFDGKHE